MWVMASIPCHILLALLSGMHLLIAVSYGPCTLTFTRGRCMGWVGCVMGSLLTAKLAPATGHGCEVRERDRSGALGFGKTQWVLASVMRTHSHSWRGLGFWCAAPGVFCAVCEGGGSFCGSRTARVCVAELQVFGCHGYQVQRQ